MKILAPHGHLEANLRLAEAEVRGAAVVCHPHPLHGGTMHTKAVFRAAQALAEGGIHALRFNFRGVGTSTGSHDGGIGEQDDVRAALDWLDGEYPHLPKVVAGFSFGSMVALSVGVSDPRAAALVGMGVAVDLYDYSFLEDAGKPILVVQGAHDQFGAGPVVRDTLTALGDHVSVVSVPGADHFFEGKLDELKSAIRWFFAGGPGAAALQSPTGAGS